MESNLPKVLLDASVIFSLFLRDILLRAAKLRFYRVYWTPDILNEVTRNLVKHSKMNLEGTENLQKKLSGLFPYSTITEYEFLIDSMPNHEKDRHVAAAAVKAGVEIIVTNNLKDFKHLPEGIQAKSPDEFLCDLFKDNPDGAVEFLRVVAAAKNNPPLDLPTLLRYIEKPLPNFVKMAAMHARIDLS